jgi:hypothetical protein
MNAYDENELEPTVERAVRVLKTEPVPDGPPPPVVATVLAAGVAETLNKHRSLRERITSMNRVAKVAAACAAAAVIIAATVVAFLVLPGGRGGTLALADMLKPITAKTAKFTITVRMEPLPPGMPLEQTTQVLVMENLMRQELPGGMYQVMELKSSRCVAIIPQQKKVMVMQMTGMPQDAKDQMSNDFFGELRRRVEELRGSGPKDVEFLPDKNIGGRLAHGFSKRLEGMEITIWADAETCLPVLMEIRHGGGAQRYFVTMSNFEFDVPLDPALFSMAIPEGYTVEERSMNMSPPTEADLVTGLRQYANMADGAFPDRIDQNTIMEILKKWIPQQSGNAQQGQIPTQEQLDTMMKVQRVLLFVMQLSGEKVDWRYAGKGVRLGDAGTPVFWYLPKGAANYRMVCGDLTVADVAPNALPDIPDAQRPDDRSPSQPSPPAQALPVPTPPAVPAPAPPRLPPRVPARATPPATPVPAPAR